MSGGAAPKGSSGDPRRPNEAKKYDRPVVNLDTQPPDPLLLVGMVFGMVALLLKVKAAAWLSTLFLASAMANMKTEAVDLKQMVSAVTFSAMGLIASYMTPVLGARA